jgi:hypothetical protein
MPNAQQRGNKDRKSRNEICRPDFLGIGRVAWWCVGRKGRGKMVIFPVHKVLLLKEKRDITVGLFSALGKTKEITSHQIQNNAYVYRR